MIAQGLIRKIKNWFGLSKDSQWIESLVEKLEDSMHALEEVPFKIVEKKSTGFVVKVKGLYAFVNLHYMPWGYSHIDCWAYVAPDLIGQIFYGYVYKIQKREKKTYMILLNGSAPQFKEAELAIGEQYTGIIIRIARYGVFLDIGSHFNWRCGSLVGLLHQFQMKEDEKIEQYCLGEKASVFFKGVNDQNKLMFCSDKSYIDWMLGKPQQLLGQILPAKVIRVEEDGICYVVIHDLYKGYLDISTYRSLSDKNEPKKLAVQAYCEGDLLTCKVVRFDKQNRLLQVVLYNEPLKEKPDKMIMNNLDEATIEKIEKLKMSMD